MIYILKINMEIKCILNKHVISILHAYSKLLIVPSVSSAPLCRLQSFARSFNASHCVELPTSPLHQCLTSTQSTFLLVANFRLVCSFFFFFFCFSLYCREIRATLLFCVVLSCCFLVVFFHIRLFYLYFLLLVIRFYSLFNLPL